MSSLIRSLLFSVSLLTWGTIAFAAKPLSPNTSFETVDGTIAPLVGEVVSGSGDGPGWLGLWTSAYLSSDIVYDNSHSTTGKWSMLLDTTGRDEEPQIGRVFSKSIKKGLIMLRVWINRTDRNHFAVFVSNGSPNLNNINGDGDNSGRAVFVNIAPEKYYNMTPGFGDVSVYDNTVETLIADNVVAANMWHEVLIEFNCNKDGGVYDVYFDGDKLNVAPLHFYQPQVSLDQIHVYTGASQNQDGSSAGPGSKHWVEDIVVWRK